MRSEATDGPERHTTLSSHALGRVGWVLPSLRSLPQSWPVKDAKLGRCIVRSEFSEYSVTAREKRLQIAASCRKRLQFPANDYLRMTCRRFRHVRPSCRISGFFRHDYRLAQITTRPARMSTAAMPVAAAKFIACFASRQQWQRIRHCALLGPAASPGQPGGQ